MKKNILVFLAFIIGLISANAQEEWSLEECIDYALTNNVDIKKQLLYIQYAEEDLLQSKLDFLPSLNGFVNHGYNWGQTVDRFTNEFATERVRTNNIYASSDLTLFNGMQKINTMKQNQLLLEVARYNADKYMDDVSLSIASAYLQTLYYIELLGVANAQLEITRLQKERTSKLVEAGTLARGDLLLIESQLAAEELNVIEVQNNIDISYLTLAQLLDLPSVENFRIEEPDIETLEIPKSPLGPRDIYEYALTTQPDVKSAELMVESSEKTLSRARGVLYPRLYISGSWGTGYSGAAKLPDTYETITGYPIGYVESTNENVISLPFEQVTGYKTKSFSNQLSDNSNETFLVNLSIPIFNKWAARSNISRAKIAIEESQYDLELTKIRLRQTIQQAYADAIAALKSHQASEKKVIATEESFNYAEQKFNVGMINSVEYNEAKKELTQAQAELVQAKYDYVFRTTVLDFYMGKPLTLKK